MVGRNAFISRPNYARPQYLNLTYDSLTRTFHGVADAMKLDKAYIVQAESWFRDMTGIIAGSESASLSVNTWLELVDTAFDIQELVPIIRLTIGIACIHKWDNHLGPSTDSCGTEFIWKIICGAVQGSLFPFHVGRSAQGFFYVPLCSIVQDGIIRELDRLHVWVPDGSRGNTEFSIHGHTAHGHGRILVGTGTDHRWIVETATATEAATHSKYKPEWIDHKKTGLVYTPRHLSSRISNTGELVTATHIGSSTYKQNMTYKIPETELHSTEIPSNQFYATFFSFNAERGMNLQAPVLGPVHGDSFTHNRDAGPIKAETLAKLIDALRTARTITDQENIVNRIVVKGIPH